MPFCACPSKVIKPNIEPFVDLVVNLKVIITDFFRSFFLFHSFYFSGGSILISSTNVNSVGPL